MRARAHATSTLALLAGALLSAGSAALPAAAQEAGAPPPLRVYLDCASPGCDRDEFRREIPFVTWVRQPQDGDVQVILTSQQTGSGGRRYTFDFVGRGPLDGFEDRLTHTSSGTDVQDERVRALTRTLALGLVRFAALAGRADAIEIGFRESPSAPEPGDLGADPADDPWDFWIFRVEADAELSGEDRRDERELQGEISANRTTAEWKLDFEVGGEWFREEVVLSDSTLVVTTRAWDVNALVVKSLGDHWSAGVDVRANNSSRLNRDLLVFVAPAVEWNLFPWDESNRRQFVFHYANGVEYVQYEEETVFFLTEETLFRHRLGIDFRAREPWGNASVGVDVSQFLDHPDQWSASLGGGVDYRVTRGLSVNIRGRYEILRDQRFLTPEVSDEEVLVGSRALRTGSEWDLSLGFGYSFGSIFNSIVNSRFPFSVRF